MDPDPFTEFGKWFEVCVEAGVHEPEAMVVSSLGGDGRLSSRHVLLKGLDHGFVFFTNYTSQKGRELIGQPVAAICFPWNVLARQVRVSGSVEQVTPEESDEYFLTRPRASQVGAWASRQSEVIDGRSTLERWVAEADPRFEGGDVPRPPHWGGFRVLPREIEFWQGRPAAPRPVPLHHDGASWRRERLSP